jgi:Spy/CpxP family protein refolding chaperone
MERVFEKTCADLEQIAQGVHSGAMSRPRAEYAAIARYQVGIMTLQLLNTLYQSTEDSTQKPAQVQPDKAELEVFGANIMVPTPTSPEVDEKVAQYLELNPAQISAIQEQLTEHQKQVERLRGQIVDNQHALSTVTQKGHLNEEQVRALALKQSRIFEQLIVADARLEMKLYSLLTSEQKRRLESMRHQEAAVRANP